jgi:probable F420-dependent oxidoreductase
MAVCEIGLVQAFDGSARFGPAYARDFAQAAESLGFHSMWVPEHIVFFEEYDSVYPYPPEPGSAQPNQLPVASSRPALFDPLLTCQALALATSTLRVGTAVALMPLRHPLLWAREVNTLDHFSGGRFELGIGVGWLAEEFAALGVPFADRGRRADEHIAALRALWADEVASFHGRHVDFSGAVVLPHPVQSPGPPILIGGDGDGPLRRVARYGDGWYPWNVTPAELDAGLLRLDEQLAAHPFIDGRTRTRDDITIQVGLRFRRSLDELAELVATYAALGASRVVVAVPISASAYEARLAEVADALGVSA